MEKVFEEVVTVKKEDVVIEDGGCAKFFEVFEEVDENDEVFVRIHSWSDEKNHPLFDSLIGKKIKVTVSREE